MGASLTWDVSKAYNSTSCTIKVILYIVPTNGSWNGDNQNGFITIGGTKHSFKNNFSSSKKQQLASASKTISRTTKDQTVSIKASYSTGISSGTITKSGSVSVANLSQYTVTFNGNGNGSNTTKKAYHGKTVTTPSVTWKGHTLKGWSTTAKGDVKYNVGASVEITSNTTLYAKWEENSTKTDSTSSSQNEYMYTYTATTPSNDNVGVHINDNCTSVGLFGTLNEDSNGDVVQGLNVDGNINISGTLNSPYVGTYFTSYKDGVKADGTKIDNRTAGASLTLSAGTYVIVGLCRFMASSSSAGRTTDVRVVYDGAPDDSHADGDLISNIGVNRTRHGSGNLQVYQQVTCIKRLGNASTSIRLDISASQQSTGNITYLYAVKIC